MESSRTKVSEFAGLKLAPAAKSIPASEAEPFQIAQSSADSPQLH